MPVSHSHFAQEDPKGERGLSKTEPKSTPAKGTPSRGVDQLAQCSTLIHSSSPTFMGHLPLRPSLRLYKDGNSQRPSQLGLADLLATE